VEIEIYDDEEGEDKQNTVNKLIEKIEEGIFIVGGSALEDQLQDKVGECIEEF
jgi:CO dehydrogenase/acetyl-CoA synthase epsilon subunit